MKKTLTLFSTLTLLVNFGCSDRNAPTFATPNSLNSVDVAEMPSDQREKTQYAGQNQPSIISNQLSSLKAGILPDTSLSESEQRVAGMLVRKTVPIFPLKIGVLLYQDYATLAERDRREFFESFLGTLKANPNVGQVIEISSNLIGRNADIEEIRKLAARFQVSSVIVLGEYYKYPYENKEALVTPSDLVTGTRTWESYSKIESYGLDILNGVFIFSTAAGLSESDKYSRDAKSVRNPDNLLMRSSAQKTWKLLEEKVNQEIGIYKKRLDENKLLPIDLNSSNSSNK
jgi:hypothetical protein